VAIDKLPKSIMELEELKRTFTRNEKNHEKLLQKRSESIISKESIISNVHIVDSATYPVYPIKPKKKFLYLSGLILGFLLSIIYSSIRIYRDKTIYSKNDISLKNYSVIYNGKKAIEDSFWTAIAYFEKLTTSHKSKIVLITSNGYQENKSFTTEKLSFVLADISKKVIIIDFDIYNAKISYKLKKISHIGLSTLLTSKHDLTEINIDDYIVKNRYKEHKNVDILLSGPIMPNGSSLLFDSKIQSLMNILSIKYDYLLIDAPPFGKYPAMITLLKYIDIFLVVATVKKTDKRFFEKLNELNEKDIEKAIFLIET
jgi:Mrp family chromosome partitioning ATPase